MVSAKTDGALREQARQLGEYLAARPAANLADVGYALAATRSLFDRRAVVVGAGREDFLHGLAALARGEPAAGLVTGTAHGTGKLAFLFTGQGSQHPGMGAGLYAAYPAFARALDDACAALGPHLGQPLQDVMFAAPGTPAAALLDQTGYTQPALFALQTALYRLLESLGIRPDYLAGHSIGELSAAHAAGILSLADAATLVTARARLMQALPPGGAMTAIAAGEAEVQASLARYPGVTIAALNGPAATVISGPRDDVTAIAASWAAQGRRTKQLTVSHAFHSPLMDPVLSEFTAIAATLAYHPPLIPVISNITGQPAAAGQLTTPAYWADHIRRTVRFHDTITTLDAANTTAYLELGPDPVLTAMAHDSLSEQDDGGPALIPALRKDRPEAQSLTAAIAELHAHGISADWDAIFTRRAGQHPDLPTYPFEHQRYWLHPAATLADASDLGLDPAGHPLLAAVVSPASGDTVVLTGRLSLTTHPWLADHAIAGLRAAPRRRIRRTRPQGRRPDRLQPHRRTHHPNPARTASPPRRPPPGNRQRTRRIRPPPHHHPLPARRRHQHRRTPTTLGMPRHRLPQPIGSPDDHTGARRPGRHLAPLRCCPASNGRPLRTPRRPRLRLRPHLPGATARLGRTTSNIYAEVALPGDTDTAGYGIHPALLDAALHAAGLGTTQGSGQPGNPGEVRLPFSWTGVSLYATGATTLRVRLSPAGPDAITVTIVDATGAPVATVDSLILRPISVDQLGITSTGSHDPLFELDWVPVAAPAEIPPPACQWAVIGADNADLPAAPHAAVYPTLASLQQALTDGTAAPDLVPAPCPLTADQETGLPAAAHQAATRALQLTQDWLADHRLTSSHLVIITHGAVAACPGEHVTDLTQPRYRG